MFAFEKKDDFLTRVWECYSNYFKKIITALALGILAIYTKASKKKVSRLKNVENI